MRKRKIFPFADLSDETLTMIFSKLIILIFLAKFSSPQQRNHQETLSQNIVTDEVKTRIVKTKYGRVQGFISRVGRDAATLRYVEMFLGVPYASPPTGNYR